MSWFSSAFTRAKGAIVGGVSMIPIVGGIAAGAIDRMHTGDEHQDANGVWVSNSTGAPVVPPLTAAAQAEVDRVRQFDQDEIARLRASAAESAAKLGAAATLKITQAIDPAGTWYKQPMAMAGGVIAVGLILLLVTRGKK